MPESSLYLPALMLFLLISWTAPTKFFCQIIIASGAAYLAYYSVQSLVFLGVMSGFCAVIVCRFPHSKSLHKAAIGITLLGFITYRIYNPSIKIEQNLAVLGFAFYALKIMHILLDSLHSKLDTPKVKDVFAWLWFWPTLLTGPINRFQEFQRELSRRRWDPDLFSRGARRILFGYAKIAILGNWLAELVLGGYIQRLDSASWLFHYLSTLKYGMLLYVKFAGYSDLAIGIALLVGIRISENFNFPFLACSIRDFWKRWHISLSSWCNDYVYRSAFASFRSGAVASILTMLVIGFWHEASFRYLFWGAWHGCGIALCLLWQKSRLSAYLNSGYRKKTWAAFSLILTLNFVVLSFVFTSTESMSLAMERFLVLGGIQ